MVQEWTKYQRYLELYAKKYADHIENEYAWVTEVPNLLVQLADTALHINQFKDLAEGNGTPIIVIPGFGTSNTSTFFMRKILEEKGHTVLPWAVEENTGFHQKDIDTTIVQLKAVSDQYGSKCNLLGWSLGGCYIRSVASSHHEYVNSIVTMGTPINGIKKIDPLSRQRYDRIVGFVDACFVHHEQFIDTFIHNPPVPTTSLWSRNDGVVHWTLSQIVEANKSENVEISGSHFSMGFALDTLKIIADRFSHSQDTWQKWDSSETHKL